MPIASNPQFLLSPPAVSLFPILVLHLVIFVYLCQVKEKSMATLWLNGWLACVMLGDLFMFLGNSVYGLPGAYLELASLVIFYISIVPSLQFAYDFPRRSFAREARLVLVVSILLVAACLTWLAAEQVFYAIEFFYSFDQYFYFNPVRTDTGLLASSVPIFDVVYLLSLVWLWGIWIRKTIHFASARAGGGGQASGWRPALKGLILPRSNEARITRSFALVMLCAPAVYFLSTMELWTSLLSGSFVALYLVVLAGLMLVYINNSSAPTSFMVKLVGISLVTLLIVLGLAIPPIMKGKEAAYDAARQAELPYILRMVEDTGPASLTGRLPVDLMYLAARSVPNSAAPFPTDYRLIFARSPDFSEESLVEEDTRFMKAVQRSAWGANPWLNPEQALVSLAGGLEPYLVPEGKRAYRGIYSNPAGHFIRYTLRSDDGQILYEIGYNYVSYRRMLHQAALLLAAFVAGTALLILLVFPRFFHSSLVQPLQNLLEGVRRVQQSELAVRVPITAPDEIGYLTDHFNGMVQSLQALTAGLHAEIGERLRAEEEVRSLNATLEQRIAYRTRELATLYEIAAAASQSPNQEALLNESLARTLVAIPADAGAIYLLNEHDCRIRQVAEAGNSAAHQNVLDQLDRLMTAPEFVDRVLRQAEATFIPNLASEPGLAEASHALHPQSLLVIPLWVRGEVVGYMGLLRGSEKAFLLDEIALLTTISQQVAIAVHSSHLRQQATLHDERERIARDLHDSVTQSLYGLLMLVENGRAQLEMGNAGSAGRTFTRMDETARQAIKEMRLFIHQLRPPDLAQVGLVGALHARLSAVEGRANIQTRLLADDGPALPEAVESALYWIAQEALNNILKHSQATSVQVFLRRAEGKGALVIVDNGIGFSPEQLDGCGMGLPGMRERAAQVGALFEIDAAPGRGTVIQVGLDAVSAADARRIRDDRP